MSLLSYHELCELCEMGVINAPVDHVNGSSIDLTMHHIIRREHFGSSMDTIRIGRGESIKTIEEDITDSELIMMPDAVVLGATVESFNMPLNLSAEFSLKSTLGRNFLGHELAGWIDPGFTGTITLELKNNNQFHKLALSAGMKIGQVKFFKHKEVPFEHSYASRGQYNGQESARKAGVLK